MKINRSIKALIPALAISSFLLLPSKIQAGTIGVSPVDFVNDHLKPGQRYTEEFIISRTELNEETDINIEIDGENIKDWFSFDPGQTFTIPKGEERYVLKITTNIPADAKLKKYTGQIRVVGSPKDQELEGDVNIIPGAVIDVELKLTDKDVVDVKVLEVTAKDSPEGDPISILFKFRNDGNTDTTPTKIELTLQDLQKKTLEELLNENLESIKAGETKEVIVKFDTEQEKGEYYGQIKVYLEDDVLWDNRIVVNISDKVDLPVVEGEKKITKTSNLIWFLVIFLLIVGFVVLVIIEQKKRKETDPKDDLTKKREASILHRKIPTPILILVLCCFALAIYLSLYQVISNYRTPKVEIKEKDEQTQEDNDTTDENETTIVEGIETSVEKDSKIYYKIFGTDDLDSEAIYLAKEGEEFEILEENEDWYKIKLTEDETGWVHSSSVKENDE